MRPVSKVVRRQGALEANAAWCFGDMAGAGTALHHLRDSGNVVQARQCP